MMAEYVCRSFIGNKTTPGSLFISLLICVRIAKVTFQPEAICMAHGPRVLRSTDGNLLVTERRARLYVFMCKGNLSIVTKYYALGSDLCIVGACAKFYVRMQACRSGECTSCLKVPRQNIIGSLRGLF